MGSTPLGSTPLLESAELSSRERIAPGFWRLGFRSPQIARRARPAHYVAIDLPGPFAVRLPLGIWSVDGDEFTLLFREWGDRTIRLAHLAADEPLSLIGPLGNEFSLPERGKRAVIVAGGIGVVPFWLLAKELVGRGVETSVILGARSGDMLVGADDLRRLGATVSVCTDDGTAGVRGSVLDMLAPAPHADMLYGCGPPGMLRALCAWANAASVPCQISMEETFGCSMGTCWGCVVPVRQGCAQATGYPRAPQETRDFDLARVCVDGTVFWSSDVRWT
jgi:dihydroorotate dehydrogenase electron transfer subunit